MTDAAETHAGTYTPGHRKAKALMIGFGLFLLALGAGQLRLPLGLVVFGERATVEATDVVKAKPGLPDLVLHNDAEIQAQLEPRDRSFIFWNEFRFTTRAGDAVTVRANVGSQLKPIYPLLDADGLPTTDVVYYDPQHPATVIFPDMISTWFAPGILLFAGLLATLIGSVLFYWAGKPIELPHLPSAPPRKEE